LIVGDNFWVFTPNNKDKPLQHQHQWGEMR